MIICGILTGLKYYIFDFNLPLAAADVFGAVLGNCRFAVLQVCNNQMWDTTWVEMLTACVG